ncbi:MAG TPA: protein kinase [Candidatus Acidoferrales bacterium]|nr:protein kinase [Candidatus Acidoferrales bacterium]
MPIQPGNHLGPYEVVAAIGAGGMGEVYRARDAKLGRDVALKVLPEAFAGDAERLARFQREAKSLASLNHSNIASIYGLEDSGSTHALVMELVEGPTLADRIKSGAIPTEEALPIAKQICEGLEYAHERGIVHRDLKPSNVKVTADDVVKILDFGLAKTMQAETASGDAITSPTLSAMATKSGMLLGTAAYMSPEQARGKLVDRRADIWAFGCVLYEMLTGKMAFGGAAITDTLAAVLRAEPDWSQLPAGTPTRVRVLLQRCLQKDPRQRLQAIGDARISLEEVLSGAPDPPLAGAAGISAPFWRGGVPWAVACVAVLAALAYVHFREKPAASAEPMRFQIPLPEKTALSVTGAFAVSPDGRLLAFAARNSDGALSLWTRSLDSLEARPLLGSESAANIFPPFIWSFDSRYIAFDAGGKLKRIDVSSGATETLCDLSDIAVGGSWNRDGVIIFGTANGGIMRVSENGGIASALTTLDSSRSESAHVLPSFLPDGRHFVYLRASGNEEDSGLYIGSLDAKPEQQASKRLVATERGPAYAPSLDDPDVGRLLFMRDRALVAQPFDARRLRLMGEPINVAEELRSYAHYGFFSSSANNVLIYRTGGGGQDSQLAWFDRQGKVLGTAGEPSDYLYPAVSPDGKRAAVSRRDLQTGKLALWLIDFAQDTSTRFTFGSFSADYPIWSPDGSRILFSSNNGGIFDIYQKPASGAKAEEALLKSKESKIPRSLSRDGHFLLYSADDPKTKHALWVLPLEGDKKPFPFLQTEFNEVDGHFSPDGRWVAYASDESGRYEIYVRKFSADATAPAVGAAGKWQVSYSGGREPRWSADGKELYYLTFDWKVMVVGVTTDPVFQSGTPKLLFQAPQQPATTEGDYTIDGKRFLFSAPAEQTEHAPFTVVLNWQSGLKK